MKKRTNLLYVAIIALMSSCADQVTQSDWPQYKKDNYRSGVAAQSDINLEAFGLEWQYNTGQEAVPAWYGPAKEDAYARSGPLPSMRDYDLSYYPIVVGSTLYYGSSADDGVHAHDVNTGEQKWVFTTGAPVRIAPTYYNGNVYVGSDDGYVYCLSGRSGKLKWKYSPTEELNNRLILNNGRFISKSPIRTGVMIEDGIAYFGASLLPWNKTYVCAVDAENGKIGKEGTYIKEYDTNSMTLEGSMASNGTFLIQPQGRISPILIRKDNGETAGALSGTGGCFVLVTPENNIVHSQTSRYVSMQESSFEKDEESGEDKEAEFMSYKDGKEIVVKGDSTYVLNDNSLVAYNRIDKKMMWLRRGFEAHRMILVGDLLFVGCADKVEAVSLTNGQTVWECAIDGTVYAISFANDALFATTSNGYIYKFSDGGKGGKYYADNFNKKAQVDEVKEPKADNNVAEELRKVILTGPYVEPMSTDSVRVVFTTSEPLVAELLWQGEGKEVKYVGDKPLTNHKFVLPVRKGFSYDYNISTKDGRFACYYYDNFFNFNIKSSPAIPEVFDKDIKDMVSSCLASVETPLGLGVVLGDDSDEISYSLANMTGLDVVNIVDSKGDYDDFTEALQECKSYGTKISALKVKDLDNIPVLPDIADLVWANEADELDADEVIRLIAPEKIAVITDVDNPQKWLESSTLDWQVSVVSMADDMLVLKKSPLEGAGVWTHQHGDLRNASYGGESLYGSTTTEDFETQWMGRPGARFITDRSGRKPAPLAVNGRMFVQGKERIAAVNAYNGQILWMKDIPDMLRMNVSRDCSNWACDDDYLYIAKDGFAVKINQITGEIDTHISMKLESDTTDAWGFIGVTDDCVIGTTTAKGAPYTDYYGGGTEGWYDADNTENASKVISYRVFSIDKDGKALNWEYLPKGAVINSTIAAYEGKLTFVESRSVGAKSRLSGRGSAEIFNSVYLVALDVKSGAKLYEYKINAKPGTDVYFLTANSGKSVLVSSTSGKYDIIAFDVESGEESWRYEMPWFEGHHGAHMSKPAIAGDRLVVEPGVFNVQTGERDTINMPKSGHGCAHLALSDNAVFYRGGSCTMYDFDARVFSKWERLRPDCWLSTVPALGLILSPEAAGGCSCGLWYETSMVFAPISRAPIEIIGHTEDSKRNYRDENWGTYYSSSNYKVFEEELLVEMNVKPGVDAQIFYTVDGSEPTKESLKYTSPITLTQTSVVRAVVYIEKGGKERRFERSKEFVKGSIDNKE